MAFSKILRDKQVGAKLAGFVQIAGAIKYISHFGQAGLYKQVGQ